MKKTKGSSPRNEAEKKAVVYVGPNLVDPLLAKMTILCGIPAHVQAAITTMPDLGLLFVPVEDLGNALKQLEEPGTPLASAYQSVFDARNNKEVKHGV